MHVQINGRDCCGAHCGKMSHSHSEPSRPSQCKVQIICHYLLGCCFAVTFFLWCFAEGKQGSSSVDSFGRWEAKREGKAEKNKLAVK